MTTQADVRLASIDGAGRPVLIEHVWIGRDDRSRDNAPLIVFLHEGLGSVAMWRDFPRALCDSIGARGLVYSRPGYGRSTPRPRHERWGVDFMHRQAWEVLPALLATVGVDTLADPPWLFGHSDGGSIALLHAAQFPGRVAGVITVAPHIFVEPLSIASIEKARIAYETGGLRERLARYHDDVDSAFYGWNDIWLAPPFRAWNIVDEVSRIECPVLAVQGCDDEYGTLEQVRGIVRRLPSTRLVELPDCGHSPHRDQPARLIEEAARFVAPAGATTGRTHERAKSTPP